MTIYRKFDDISADFTACIGFFDGVHLGHRFLLRHLTDEAHRHGRLSAVITFANHPRKVVQPDFDLRLIDSLDERLAKIAEAGVDACFVLDFTEEVRQLTAKQFISDFLSSRLHVRELLIGYDHRFGRNRAEGFDDYVRYGNECGMLIVKEPVFQDDAQLHYSSSEVRRALALGDVALANRLLGSFYSLEGKVVSGHQLGRKLGFPTANIEPLCADKIIPAIGVYAAMVRLKDGSSHKAMLNIGVRPTVDNTNKITLEVHILDFSGDLYDEDIMISFVSRLRDERRMGSLDELQSQLSIDCKRASEILTL
ncbi:MAG: riboflavin biosynthesis protein RibF [Bacteroidales bacterium]|nr:riboflavin biosynthesis protein RibF [Candidatus Liminaster caballi]